MYFDDFVTKNNKNKFRENILICDKIFWFEDEIVSWFDVLRWSPGVLSSISNKYILRSFSMFDWKYSRTNAILNFTAFSEWNWCWFVCWRFVPGRLNLNKYWNWTEPNQRPWKFNSRSVSLRYQYHGPKGECLIDSEILMAPRKVKRVGRFLFFYLSHGF